MSAVMNFMSACVCVSVFVGGCFISLKFITALNEWICQLGSCC